MFNSPAEALDTMAAGVILPDRYARDAHRASIAEGRGGEPACPVRSPASAEAASGALRAIRRAGNGAHYAVRSRSVAVGLATHPRRHPP